MLETSFQGVQGSRAVPCLELMIISERADLNSGTAAFEIAPTAPLTCQGLSLTHSHTCGCGSQGTSLQRCWIGLLFCLSTACALLFLYLSSTKSAKHSSEPCTTLQIWYHSLPPCHKQATNA